MPPAVPAPSGFSRLERRVLALVALHTTLAALHALAHLQVPVQVASVLDGTLIAGGFFAGPLLAAILLASRPRPGATLLAASMTVALAYGTLEHGVLAGPDHVASLPPGSWSLLFMTTAALLAALEILGLALALALLRRPPTQHPQAAPSP